MALVDSKGAVISAHTSSPGSLTEDVQQAQSAAPMDCSAVARHSFGSFGPSFVVKVRVCVAGEGPSPCFNWTTIAVLPERDFCGACLTCLFCLFISRSRTAATSYNTLKPERSGRPLF